MTIGRLLAVKSRESISKPIVGTGDPYSLLVSPLLMLKTHIVYQPLVLETHVVY